VGSDKGKINGIDAKEHHVVVELVVNEVAAARVVEWLFGVMGDGARARMEAAAGGAAG
jgi:hypothetical protein